MNPNTTITPLAQPQGGQGDTSFINDITPWLPDFLSTRLTDVAGVALAIGIIVAIIGGVILWAGISASRQDGRADQVSARVLWWGGGLIGLGVLIPISGWMLG